MDIAFAAQCCLCGNCFMTIVQSDVAPEQVRHPNNEHSIVQIQQRCSADQILRCPNCVELVNGVPYSVWVTQLDSQTTFSPCFALKLSQEQYTPLYYGNTNGTEWQLLIGNGPSKIGTNDMSYRIVYIEPKPLMNFVNIQVERGERSQKEFKYMYDTIDAYVTTQGRSDESFSLNASLFKQYLPAYRNWNEIARKLEDGVLCDLGNFTF